MHQNIRHFRDRKIDKVLQLHKHGYVGTGLIFFL